MRFYLPFALDHGHACVPRTTHCRSAHARQCKQRLLNYATERSRHAVRSAAHDEDNGHCVVRASNNKWHIGLLRCSSFDLFVVVVAVVDVIFFCSINTLV